jgi:two-component system sensor histidine kinase KdpD
MPETGAAESGKLGLRAAFPPDSAVQRADLAAARWSWDAGRPTGRGTDTLPGGRWLFMPIRTSRSSIAVIGVLRVAEAGDLSPSDRQLLEAVGNQTAVALERVALAADIDQARLGVERERLRSAMLTSVSHDLRTPLASIQGALSSLRSYGERYDKATRDELLGTALSEAERLDRFVGNLLDMTRLDAGVIDPKRETVDVGDLVSTTLRRAQPLLGDHVVASTVAPDLPPLSLDFVLAEQALFNILDNARQRIRRPAAASRSGGRAGGRVEIVVRDEGRHPPGVDRCSTSSIAPTRRSPPRRHGLGLAIARASSRSGGTIAARNRAIAAARIRVSYPV